jgi:hypothetical protein
MGALLVVFAMVFAFAGSATHAGSIPDGDARLFSPVEHPVLHQASHHEGIPLAYRPHTYRATDRLVTHAGLLPAPRVSLSPDQWIGMRDSRVAGLHPDQAFPAQRASRGPPPADVPPITS